MKNKYLNPILVLLLMASLLFIPYLYKGEITSSLFAYANKADELVLDDGSDLSRDALIDGTSPFIEGDKVIIDDKEYAYSPEHDTFSLPEEEKDFELHYSIDSSGVNDTSKGEIAIRFYVLTDKDGVLVEENITELSAPVSENSSASETSSDSKGEDVQKDSDEDELKTESEDEDSSEEKADINTGSGIQQKKSRMLGESDPYLESQASGTCGDNLRWELFYDTREDADCRTVLIISGQGDMYDYSDTETFAPWYYFNYDNTGNLNYNIEKVIVEDGVTSIGDYAFCTQQALKSVLLPDSLTRIGKGAFYGGESLNEITIPSGVTTIDEYAFRYSSLTKLNLNHGLTSIGQSAFEDCEKLTNVTFPDSLRTIDYWAFLHCSSLTSVIIPDGTERLGYEAFGGCKGITNVVIPESVTDMGGGDEYYICSAFSGCDKLHSAGPIGGNYNIKFGWKDKIPEGAFRGMKNLHTVIIPDGVKIIGKRMCDGSLYSDDSSTSINKIVIPDSVETVGAEAFCGCTVNTAGPKGSGCNVEFGWTDTLPEHAFAKMEINKLILPDGLRVIEENTLDCPAVKEIILPSSLKVIGEKAFNYYLDITSIDIPYGVTTIENNAFEECFNLRDITIPGSVTDMGKDVFSRCWEIKSAGPIGGDYNIKFGWTDKIPDNAFYQSYDWEWNLKKVVLPNGLKSIGKGAFNNSIKLTEITIPDGVKEIGAGAFADCRSLYSVIIPSSVDTFGYDYDYDRPFDGCVNLVTAGPIGGNYNIKFGWTDRIPAGAFASGRRYEEQSGMALRRIVFPDGLKEIGSGAFSGCRKLSSVIIPDGTETIGDNVFSGCTNLSQLIIPVSVTEVGERIVSGCIKLKTAGALNSGCSIQFGWKRIIPERVFSECSGLEEVTLPNGIVAIYANAFYNCQNLEKVRIPATVSSMGRISDNDWQHFGTFGRCPKLETAGFTGSGSNIEFEWIDEIPESAFEDSSIREITMPNGISIIGDYAFRNCKSLERVQIPSTSTDMGEEVFYGCTKLTSAGPIGSTCDIRFGWTNKIPSSAFEYCTNLSYAEIPESITEIGYKSFRNCSSLNEIEIPGRVKTIDSSAFEGCSGLTEITLPNSLRNIYGNAFKECSSLNDVYFCGTETEWNGITISNSGNEPLLDATLHFTRRITESGILKSGDGWQIKWSCSYIEKREGGKKNAELRITATGLDDWTYMNSDINDGNTMPWLTEEYGFTKDDIIRIYISGPLYIIPNQFAGYSNLLYVELREVYGVAQSSFCNCTKLSCVHIYGNDLTTIDQASFKNDTNLWSVEFMSESGPSSLVNIGSEAFANTRISSLELSDSLEKIGSGAFRNTPMRSIYLDRKVNNIGNDAFDGCNLTINCYKNSYAHNYAKENNIPFKLLDVPVYPVLKHGDNNELYACSNTFEGCLFETTSGNYNRDLSCILAVLSRAVYSNSQISDNYENLGFENTISDFADDATVGYIIGRKKVDDTTIILLTIRGSYGWSWASNFDISCLATGIHTGFNMDADLISTALRGYPKYPDTNRTVYVITGHSQGAAAGNLVAKRLIDSGVSSSNLYDYNFACPNVARCPQGEDSLNYWNKNGKYNSIFNIGNSSDPVTCVPAQFFVTWGKFGRSYWFDSDAHEMFGHDMKYYTDHMQKMNGLERFKTRDEFMAGAAGLTQFFGIHCPVDVTIYNSNGIPVAGVSNNTPLYYDSEFGEVIIFTENDEKYFFLPAGEEYTVSMTATDSGEMQFEVGLANLAAQTIEQKQFDSIQLSNDKEMQCQTGGEISVEDSKLYVLDDASNIVSEIETDGSEHPLSNEDCDHEWNDTYTVDRDSTCTEEGIKSIHCSICGAVKEGSEEVIPVKPHEYGKWTTTKAATELASGTKTCKCAVCGNIKKMTIAKLKPSLKAVTILKPKAAKKAATIRWKKITKINLKKTKKVQIQYSTDKNFKKNVKSKYAKATKTSYKLTKLKSKKKYYVRIRAYTKSGSKVHVSKWSKKRYVKVK